MILKKRNVRGTEMINDLIHIVISRHTFIELIVDGF